MSFVSAGSVAAAFAPLHETLGSRLTIVRDRGVVRWCFDGLEAVVESTGPESVGVIFRASGLRDAVMDGTIAPQYRSDATYRLTSDGAKRLAGDVLAFFSGTREPRFRFVGFHEAALIRS